MSRVLRGIGREEGFRSRQGDRRDAEDDRARADGGGDVGQREARALIGPKDWRDLEDEDGSNAEKTGGAYARVGPCFLLE